MTVRFVEEKVLPDDGQVNHALRGALICLLKDYLVRWDKVFETRFLCSSSNSPIKIRICVVFFIVSVIRCAAGDAARTRQTESTKNVVLRSTDDGNHVHTLANNFEYLQGSLAGFLARQRN